jgi:glutaconate CoA-transferase, subunit A
MPEFVSVSEAANLIKDNSTLALGGMTIYRRPVGFVRALLSRSRLPQNLTLLCFTASIESDFLIGAGCVKTVRSVYFGLESFGLAPMFTQAAQQNTITILEETEASLSMGLRARMSGIGFMPSRAWLNTDLPRLRPDVKTVVDPYTGETLMAFPAIDCDTAVIHALEVDRAGNARLNNNLGIDMELVYVAKHVIVTADRIVDKIERTTEGLIIPSPGIDHIVHLPRGASPTSCYPLYPVNGGEFLNYIDSCNSGKFTEYLALFLQQASPIIQND